MFLTLSATCQGSYIGSSSLFLLRTFCLLFWETENLAGPPIPLCLALLCPKRGHISRGGGKGGRDVEPEQSFSERLKEPRQQHHIQTPLNTLPARFICSENQERCLGSDKRLKKAEAV